MNCILPMYLAHDEEILFRDNYTTWTKRKIPVVKPVLKQYIITDKTDIISSIVNSRLNTITDAGHPILRAAAYSLGGYVGAGYLEKEVAIAIIENAIESHIYLSQKAGDYKRTAKTMINKGELNPLYLGS
jgi:hypothetical protein